jgi:hypothetical protein
MNPKYDDAPPASGANVRTVTSTQQHSTSLGYSPSQRGAAVWAVKHANRWREQEDADKRIATLEARIAQLERLVNGEQVS